MNEQGFVGQSEEKWRRLAILCDRAELSPARLSSAELHEMVTLYRRVSRDLAIARTKSTNLSLIGFLNDLSGRAYGILYRQPRESVGKSLLSAIVFAAQTVRRRKWFVIVSASIFVFSIFLALGLMHFVPSTRDYFVPGGFEESFKHWKDGNFEDTSTSHGVMMTGFYVSNNPRVAIITGAIGAGTFGLMSVQLLFQNGAILGVLIHELAPYHRVGYLLSSIFAQGVPEIGGAIMSGAAGLLFGWALINPGRNRRGDALRKVGTDAVTLIGVAVVLMFMAAPIEGFFDFNARVPVAAKIAVGTIELVAWLLFWAFFGLSDEERASRATSRD